MLDKYYDVNTAPLQASLRSFKTHNSEMSQVNNVTESAAAYVTWSLVEV